MNLNYYSNTILQGAGKSRSKIPGLLKKPRFNDCCFNCRRCVSCFLGNNNIPGQSKPIAKMVDAADKLALGDVNVVINADGKDEVGRLASSFDKMIDNIRSQAHTAERLAAGDLTVDVDIKSENDLLGIKLSEMIRNIKEAMENISHAAEQVATGAKQVFQSSRLFPKVRRNRQVRLSS